MVQWMFLIATYSLWIVVLFVIFIFQPGQGEIVVALDIQVDQQTTQSTERRIKKNIGRIRLDKPIC